jgi:hypothetical protein
MQRELNSIWRWLKALGGRDLLTTVVFGLGQKLTGTDNSTLVTDPCWRSCFVLHHARIFARRFFMDDLLVHLFSSDLDPNSSQSDLLPLSTASQ